MEFSAYQRAARETSQLRLGGPHDARPGQRDPLDPERLQGERGQRCGLVTATAEGRRIRYELSDPHLAEALRILAGLRLPGCCAEVS